CFAPSLSLSLPHCLSFSWFRPSRVLHSFPTRRSSDLFPRLAPRDDRFENAFRSKRFSSHHSLKRRCRSSRRKIMRRGRKSELVLDRKSTRLNSSHVETSYAVFCLKKKNKDRRKRITPT